MESSRVTTVAQGRAAFIGGSDARIIMGEDESALVRLWREKRSEIDPEDRSANLIAAGRRDRGAQSALVRAEHQADPQGCPAPDPTSSDPMDGRDPRRGCRRDRGRVFALQALKRR